MTETSTSIEEQSSAVQAGDLSKRLIECRDKAGLDLEQAAEEMHLSANILRFLEQEDFSRLPEPPYVRGYLRGYAKLADTDPKALIRTYEALRGANPDEIAHHFAPARPLNRVTHQPAISAATIKLVLMALLVLGVGLISMIPAVRDWASSTWAAFSAKTAPPQVTRPAPALDTFTAQKDAEEKAATQVTPAAITEATTPAAEKPADTAATTAPPADKPADAPATSTATTDKPADAPATSTTTTDKPADSITTANATPNASDKPADNTSTPSVPATPATPANSSTQDVASTAPNTATAIDTTTPPATPSTTPTAGTTPPATTSVAGATPTATTPPAGTATPPTEGTNPAATTPAVINGEVTIKLEFSEDVWMQVKDKNKKALFEALNTSGTTKEFKATTPLDFKIGNAHGVKVYLNGQLYDQAPHTKGIVSRFKVE